MIIVVESCRTETRSGHQEVNDRNEGRGGGPFFSLPVFQQQLNVVELAFAVVCAWYVKDDQKG